MTVENDSSQVQAQVLVQAHDQDQAQDQIQGLSGSGFPTFPVAPGYQVNVRTGPGTGYSISRVLPLGAYVSIHCQCDGTTVSGPYGTTNIWDCVGNGEFVSDAYVKTGSDGYVATRCG